jgi:NADH:ubiquinone oxidoreductase subunit 2 (subunit N)
VVFAGLNSVLSLGYYAPLVNRMYRLKPAQVVESGVKPSWQLELPLVIMAAAVVVLGFMPHLMSWLTGPAAASLLASIAR